MTQQEVKDFLTSSEEGRQLYKELTSPLENKKNEILGEKKDLQSQFRELSETIKELESQLDKEKNYSDNLIIDNALNKAVSELKITPSMQKAVKSMFKSDITLAEVEGERVCKIGEKDFSDYIQEWGVTEEAKHFISAPVNRGGGAVGSMGGATQKSNMKNMTSQEILNNLSDFNI